MDGLKLEKWKRSFKEQIAAIEIEFNSFFLNKKIEDYYSLLVNHTSEELELKIAGELPHEIKDCLLKAFLAAKPEDSI